MRTIREIGIYENIPILVRSALNVPIDAKSGAVTNAYRLRRAVPTLRYLSERGARVIVISHLGEKGTESLAPVAATLGELVPRLSFCQETIGANVREKIRAMHPGDVLVLENLRRDKREVANDVSFSRELASLADVFVQDSFDTCHRKHASMIGVSKLLPAYAGLLLEEEVVALSEALTPSRPSLAVIGGAKFSTKEPVLSALLKTYDKVFVGGALANDFLKASGHEVGKSLVSDEDDSHIKEYLKNPKIVLPADVVVSTDEGVKEGNAREHARVVGITEVGPSDIILDVGPGSSLVLAHIAAKAKTTLWNGPLGNYENAFVESTDRLARAVAASGAHSVVGGGDTIASIEKLGLFSKFSFVSTGGGAMLEFLGHGTLPGITALG